MPVPNSPTNTYKRIIPVELPPDIDDELEVATAVGKPPRPVYTAKFDQGRYTVGVETYINNNNNVEPSSRRKMSCPGPSRASLGGLAAGGGPGSGGGGGGGGYHRSRERTRQSAVQRLVDRKQAQKEKEREKERDRSLGNTHFTNRYDSFSNRQSFHSYSPNTRNHHHQRDSSGSRSENGFILGAGRCSSPPSKENIEPEFYGCRRRAARSVSGTRIRGSNEEPIAKTYITIGPGKPTRIREHSPAKSAKLSSDETVTSARERFAQSRSGSPLNLSRPCSPSPHRKTSRTISPSKSKDILRKASPLKSTDILKTFRVSKSDTKFNHLTDVNENSEPFITEKVLKVNQSFQNLPPSSSTNSSRRLSQDILRNIKNCHQTTQKDSNKRASPDSDDGSSSYSSPNSSPSSSLSGSTDSVESATSDDKTASILSQRRISLEQRFQARAASSASSSARFSASEHRRRPSAVVQDKIVTNNIAENTANNNHKNSTNNTFSQSSRFDASAKVDDTWTHIKIRRYSTIRSQREFTSTTAADINNSRLTNGNATANSSKTNGCCLSATRGLDRPIPASRKISLPQSAAAKRPEPAPRRRSLTTIVIPERLADEKKEEGNQLYKGKNYRDALQKYSEAIDLCPQCAAFYGNRSACYLMLSQPRQALSDARTATVIDPLFKKGWSRLAKCSVLLGDTVTARQALQNAGQEGEAEMKSIETLDRFKTEANTAYDNKDFRKALYCFDKCLEFATHSLSLKASRAECLAFLGRYAEAQEVANGVLGLDNMNADAYYVRGLCLYHEDNIDRAVSHFTQVLRLAPDHNKAKESYKKARALKQKKEEGNTSFKLGNLDEAYRLYSEALNIDPLNRSTNSKLFFNRATVSAKQKKLDQSIADCNKAIELDTNYTKAYLRRAKSYMETEQFEEAVRDYETVTKSDKSNKEYRQLLHDAKLQLRKSKRKDYYKILGVDKNANDEEVKKAYRKRAMIHHPDRHSGGTEQEKKDHEHKFKEVGEAYAVLSDEKKRRMYDSGQDLEEGGGHGYHDVDPDSIFQAFFGGMGGMGGHPGMGGAQQHFSFGGGPGGGGGGGGQTFSFQFG